ncbi:MAG: hypothetical protein IPN33_25460 [Saprospiraceae bacterium]|nr:hypothetical protein [Saprospiraceae bacterium]
MAGKNTAKATQVEATCVVTRISVSPKNGNTYMILKQNQPTDHPVIGEVYQTALLQVGKTKLAEGDVVALQDLAGVNLVWR